MDRIWQWAWNRYGTRYSWACYAVTLPVLLPIYLVLSFVVVAFEHSGRYVEATAVTAIAIPVMVYAMLLPGRGSIRIAENWVAGLNIERASALNATYTWARRMVAPAVAANAIIAALLAIVVGTIAGASGSRSVQYGIVGAVFGTLVCVIAVHSFVEAALRPVRVAIAGDTDMGDSLPRAHPTFAAWSNVSLLSTAFVFAISGAMLAAVIDRAADVPVLAVVIGCALTVGFAVPITVGAAFAPSCDPFATSPKALSGSRRVTTVNACRWSRMTTSARWRHRLTACRRVWLSGNDFRQRSGLIVDPGLAARLLEQGDDIFTGERRQVTVMFVDIRDFTPFAEANTAEDTVARLNALFEIVPAVVDGGGHVNKFLGDGALAVFGAPNDLANHADAALTAAALIQRLVAERFGGELRIGVGINTGLVIAGTIGGAGKLEFTLIGDTVNVAARVEQLTKTTGDTILLTPHCADALVSRPPGLTDRGLHALKGKSAAVQVFGLDPATEASSG